MENNKRRRGRPSKAVVFPPVHRAIMEPEIAKDTYIFNVRHGWYRLEKGKLIPINNSRMGAGMADTAAKSP